MHVHSNTPLESNINVTPLVDVCLVLLIIFMIVMPTLVNGIPVKLPVARGERVGQQQINITVKEDGTVFIGPVVVRKEQVASELRRLHGQQPYPRIAVRGDKRVSYGEVASILEACRDTGFDDVGLITSPPALPAANR